jgi:type IV pilus assembly protein PilO
MNTKATPSSLDVSSLVEQAASQFRGLNPKEPGQWPLLPKAASWLATVVAVVVACWFGLLSGATDELQAERDREPALKKDYLSKLGQAVNLSELRKQKLQVQEYVTQLEKQLPGKAEMDALLSDINQAGLGRGLQFELFRPGQVEIKDYYAEFAADIANLSRIVTLHNLAIAPPTARDSSGNLAMEATARTYRYLDADEVAQQQKAAAEKAAKAAGAKK